jgi:exonuclease VII large subunit
LPAFPQKIAVLTSPVGAAVHDVPPTSCSSRHSSAGARRRRRSPGP